MLISFPSLLRSLRHLRRLELYLKFFNRGFASVLFLIKCSCLLVTILCGFSAIRLVHKNPLISVIYIVITINSALFYIILYQTAFQITGRIEELRKVIKLKSLEFKYPKMKKYCWQILDSVSTSAINVGGFHLVERESVPMFLDFSL